MGTANKIYQGNTRDFQLFAQAGAVDGNYNERALQFFREVGATANSFNEAQHQAALLGFSLQSSFTDEFTTEFK